MFSRENYSYPKGRRPVQNTPALSRKRAAMNRSVKAMLVKQGISQKEIADDLSVTRSAVSSVINGHSNSQRIKEHIAKKLDKPYDKVWGKPA